ncbi:MAG TPA: DUF4920 domain-containing protein [Polyangiaceae bacterium]|jgi:hypothetical protein
MSGLIRNRVLSTVCVVLCACKVTPTPSPEGVAAVTEPIRASPHQLFGAPLSAAGETSLADLLRSPKTYRDQSVTVAGRVKSACTRRGCWMQISAESDPAAPSCRVTFKDYGFFVPTDSAGSQAKVQGSLTIDTVPSERVAHLESEGAKFGDKNPDGSANELHLVATGVELWR